LRKHSPESVVEVLSQYVEAGFDKFFFVDNTFNLPPSYAKSLCDLLVAAGLKISWRCILYPRNVDEELVAKMARAGCKEVSLGFESGSSKILRIIGKNFQPREIKQVAERLKKYGIRRAGFLLLGGPGESKETVKESLAFADSLALEFMKITVGIRIYPYTELARTAVREGLIKPGDDLFLPKFYMSHGLEDWLRTTVTSWSDKRPNWAVSEQAVNYDEYCLQRMLNVSGKIRIPILGGQKAYIIGQPNTSNLFPALLKEKGELQKIITPYIPVRNDPRIRSVTPSLPRP